MTKRTSKESARDRVGSADMVDPPPNKRKKTDGDTLWIKDDTLDSQSSDDEKPSVTVPTTSDEDYEEDEEEAEEEAKSDFIDFLMTKYATKGPNTRSQRKKNDDSAVKLPLQLTKSELAYFKSQPAERQNSLCALMTKMTDMSLAEGSVPPKFRVLELPVSDYIKSNVIKKITAVEEMGPDSGESYKLRNWIDAFLKVPFGKIVPLPVTLEHGAMMCNAFMTDARRTMDKHIYGMVPAKTQILQIIAQLIVNPQSVGNVIALQGAMGVGKTSLARNAIAEVMKRPFEFFSLGGASDVAGFVGHSYTYEGSMWGRIADSLMHAGAMNPVMYFDELDKVSTTPHGEEIVNMMIHLTDRSQNSQFHDRYFSGVDFDLSQCLFVFSFNDIEKVHPILRDRMTVIHCGGYTENDKKAILKDYIWPQLLDRLKFNPDEIILTDAAIKHIITEYSADEKGVRTLIRTVESMMTRLNMLRVMQDESMKEYVFYVEYTSPFTLTESVARKLLTDLTKKDPEHWRVMYN
uniref:ATPase AAA-type core domain-containing protein n=1 Tax=viral metagenome TaxID=1070528 RepID=A0A6C0DPJ9_9ZZZZ